MMKNWIAFVVLTVASVSFAFASGSNSVALTCAITISAPTTYVVVEEFHVIDICMPFGERVERAVIGDSMGWRVDSHDNHARIIVKPIDAPIRSNMILYVKDAPEKRYEIRLFGTNKVTE